MYVECWLSQLSLPRIRVYQLNSIHKFGFSPATTSTLIQYTQHIQRESMAQCSRYHTWTYHSTTFHTYHSKRLRWGSMKINLHWDNISLGRVCRRVIFTSCTRFSRAQVRVCIQCPALCGRTWCSWAGVTCG